MPRKKDLRAIDESKPIRVRQSDLSNCVLPLNIKRKGQNPLTPTTTKTQKTVRFTIYGKHNRLCDINGNEVENGFPITDDDDECMARVDYVTPPKYYIKVDATGKPYNAIGIESGTLNKDLKYKKQWNFKEVNKKAFNFYLNFLKTKNLSWLNNAGREIF